MPIDTISKVIAAVASIVTIPSVMINIYKYFDEKFSDPISNYSQINALINTINKSSEIKSKVEEFYRGLAMERLIMWCFGYRGPSNSAIILFDFYSYCEGYSLERPEDKVSLRAIRQASEYIRITRNDLSLSIPFFASLFYSACSAIYWISLPMIGWNFINWALLMIKSANADPSVSVIQDSSNYVIAGLVIMFISAAQKGKYANMKKVKSAIEVFKLHKTTVDAE